MRFIEDEEIYLFDRDVAVGQALVKNLSSTDNDLVLGE